jgi:hypothetical protein
LLSIFRNFLLVKGNRILLTGHMAFQAFHLATQSNMLIFTLLLYGL